LRGETITQVGIHATWTGTFLFHGIFRNFLSTEPVVYLHCYWEGQRGRNMQGNVNVFFVSDAVFCFLIWIPFYFRCRNAGYKSVSGRSCDRPSRHRVFL